MKSKIIKQEKNPFLEREEFLMEIECDSTPSKTEIVEELGKDKDLTIVRKVNGVFGTCKFVADIVVYDGKEAKDNYLVIPKKIKKKMEEERKAEEKKKKEEEAKAAAEAEAKAKEDAASNKNEEEGKKEENDAEEVKEEEKKE